MCENLLLAFSVRTASSGPTGYEEDWQANLIFLSTAAWLPSLPRGKPVLSTSRGADGRCSRTTPTPDWAGQPSATDRGCDIGTAWYRLGALRPWSLFSDLCRG